VSSNLTEQAKKLSIPERLALVQEIWDSIAEDNEYFELSDEQRQELDRRLDSFRVNPSPGRTWDEIKAEFLNSKPRSEATELPNPFLVPALN
jgi:putative addiction module component (TIGR02574 family)